MEKENGVQQVINNYQISIYLKIKIKKKLKNLAGAKYTGYFKNDIIDGQGELSWQSDWNFIFLFKNNNENLKI